MTSQPKPERGPPRRQFLLACLVLLIACALAHLTFLLVLVPGVIQGSLFDADGYVRLVRVESLLEHRDWFDGSIRRSNAPHGQEIHWTRPLDILLIGLSGLIPAETRRASLYWAGVWISPLLHLGAMVGLVWASAPLLARRARPAVIVGLLAQPMVTAYALAGSVDHHMLHVLFFIIAVGCLLRAIGADRPARWAVLAGGSCALGVWVSVEFLLPVLALMVALAVLWIFEPGVLAGRTARLFCAGLAAGLLLSIVVERRPTDWFVVDYERTSVAFVGMAAAWLIGWSALAWLSRVDRGWLRSAGARAAVGLGVAGAMALALVLALPGFPRGPAGEISHEIAALYIRFIPEHRSIWPRSISAVGGFTAFMGPVLLALVMVPTVINRCRDRSSRALWLATATAVAVLALGPLFYARLVIYPSVLAVLVLVFVAVPGADGPFDAAVPLRTRVRRAGRTASVLAGPLVIGGLLHGLLAGRSEVPVLDPGPGTADCPIRRISEFLAEGAGGEGVLTVLATPETSTEVLYRTPHRVLTIGWHNESGGLLDVFSAMATQDEAASRAIISDRDVDLALLCPSRDDGFFLQRPTGGRSMYERLVGGQVLPWASRIELPESLGDEAVLIGFGRS